MPYGECYRPLEGVLSVLNRIETQNQISHYAGKARNRTTLKLVDKSEVRRRDYADI